MGETNKNAKSLPSIFFPPVGDHQYPILVENQLSSAFEDKYDNVWCDGYTSEVSGKLYTVSS